jgi:colicin import membrane protein
MSALAFPLRQEPALGRSATLSALVHIVLFAVLVFGVRWQSQRPDVVEVELWEAPPVVQPAPPPPAPPQAVQPAPKVEPVMVPKPDIVVREKPKPKPKPEPKKAPPKAAPPPPKPRADPAFEKRLREQAAQEQKALQREQALQQLLARQKDDARQRELDARARGLATWQDRIRAKIRGNIVLPQGIVGNPEAIFDVVQLPSGEILNVVKRKSSGHAGYDEAVERAILKSSPLPKPEQAGLFQRELKLNFRPLDQ